MIKKYYYPPQNTLFYVQVIPNPNSNYGTTVGTGYYSQGTSITIQAIPNSGYKFLQWEDQNTSSSRTITVNASATYNALFYMESTSELRFVDENNYLYSYAEYDALQSKPNIIGVGIQDGTDWLITYYKELSGYKWASDRSLNSEAFPPSSAQQLLYPHNGKQTSNVSALKYSGNYAAYQCQQLTVGGLEWYLPNLYESVTILSRASDQSSGSNDGFNSYLSLLPSGYAILKTNMPTGDHGYWTSDVGIGGSATAGMVLPYRVYNTSQGVKYFSSGSYTYADDNNYVRPVARIPFVKITVVDENNNPITPDVIKVSNNVIDNYTIVQNSIYINLSQFASSNFVLTIEKTGFNSYSGTWTTDSLQGAQIQLQEI